MSQNVHDGDLGRVDGNRQGRKWHALFDELLGMLSLMCRQLGDVYALELLMIVVVWMTSCFRSSC